MRRKKLFKDEALLSTALQEKNFAKKLRIIELLPLLLINSVVERSQPELSSRSTNIELSS